MAEPTISDVREYARTFAPSVPPHYAAVLERSNALAFSMNSDVLTGGLLRTLVHTRPSGRFLELGTGCGLGTTWLLDGMGPSARLVSVDNDDAVQSVARDLLSDARTRFVLADAATFVAESRESFDVIYADAWPGKFSHLDETLALLSSSGVYVVDDLLPQPNWPEGHATRVMALLHRLANLPAFRFQFLNWSTGIGLLTRET